MFRSVTYSSADVYCRYLDISLSSDYCSGVAGGRFGYYLKDNFSIEKLPYDIKLSQLIHKGALTPDLFVKLPASFFRKWTNFPECPAIWKGEKTEEEEAAGKYDIHCFNTPKISLQDLLHPYDADPLKQDFVQRFSSNLPKYFKKSRISKSRSFVPFEAYLAYWRGYVLADSLIGYLDIPRFLPQKRGVAKFVARVAAVNDEWNETYRDTFNRLSMYRVAMSIIHSGNSKTDLTFQEIAGFLLEKNAATTEDLENDLEKLLGLFRSWQQQIDREGRWNLNKPIELLKQDVYHVFEWLCASSGLSEKHYFDKWAQLKDVIAYEEFDLQKTFLTFMKFYCEELNKFAYAENLNDVYTRLCRIDSFAPWIRSFCEMHKSINKKGIIHFEQPRILDYLIVMTIRTEIVIRSMYYNLINKEDPPDLTKVFSGLASGLKDNKVVKVLRTLQNDWTVTRLNDKPKDIFSKIDAIGIKNGWSNDMMHFYRQILKFVTSRNYFAHHSYKDEIINRRDTSITADVLKSCIHSLLFIDKLLLDTTK